MHRGTKLTIAAGFAILLVFAALVLLNDGDGEATSTPTDPDEKSEVLPAAYEGPCGRANALRDAGQTALAVKAYRDLLPAAAPAKCAVRGLRKLVVDEQAAAAAAAAAKAQDEKDAPGWWQDFRDWFEDAQWLLELAVALLALLALAFLLPQLYREIRRRLTPSLEVVISAAADDGTVLGLQSAIAQQLAQLRERGAGRSVRMIRASDPKVGEIPEKVTAQLAAVGNIEALLRFLGRLLPSRTTTVTLTVRPADLSWGAGVAAEMRSRTDVLGEHVFWESHFGAVDPESKQEAGARLQRLMVPVSVWIAYGLTEDLKGKKPKPLGTSSWQSYAQFAVGALAQRAGNQEGAKERYLQALDIDYDNEGARLNLAALSEPGEAIGLLGGLADGEAPDA